MIYFFFFIYCIFSFFRRHTKTHREVMLIDALTPRLSEREREREREKGA